MSSQAMDRKQEHQNLTIYFYAILMAIQGIATSLWRMLYPQPVTRPSSETRLRPAHLRKFSAASTLSSTPTLVEPSEESNDTFSLASSDTLVDELLPLSPTTSIEKKSLCSGENCKKHFAKFRKSRSSSPPVSPNTKSPSPTLLSPTRSNTMPLKKLSNSPCKVLRRLGSHPPPPPTRSLISPSRSSTMDLKPRERRSSNSFEEVQEEIGLRSVSISGKPTSRRRRKV